MKKQTSKSILILGSAGSIAIAILTSMSVAHAEWTLDLSRRTQQMRKQELNPNYGRETEGRSPSSVRTWDGEEPAQPYGASSSRPLDGSVDAPVVRTKSESNFIERVFDAGEPSQDIVILNTDRGFVPNTIRVRKDGRYTVHVVNVNEKEKNVSFILDGFSEHHATFFGKVKTFKLEPRKEGIYSFLSPETAVEGRFIVFSSGPPTVRVPATAQAYGTPGAPQISGAPSAQQFGAPSAQQFGGE
jgi:hypothetical protein